MTTPQLSKLPSQFSQQFFTLSTKFSQPSTTTLLSESSVWKENDWLWEKHGKVHEDQDSLMQTIQRPEGQMSKLANLQYERQKGILPSQPIMNPKNSQQAHFAKDQSLNQCNAVHTLRSGKKVDNQVSTPPNPSQHNHTPASTSSSPILPNLTNLKQISQQSVVQAYNTIF